MKYQFVSISFVFVFLHWRRRVKVYIDVNEIVDVRKNAFYALSIDDVLFSSDKILKELKEDPFEEKLKLWNYLVTFSCFIEQTIK